MTVEQLSRFEPLCIKLGRILYTRHQALHEGVIPAEEDDFIQTARMAVWRAPAYDPDRGPPELTHLSVLIRWVTASFVRDLMHTRRKDGFETTNALNYAASIEEMTTDDAYQFGVGDDEAIAEVETRMAFEQAINEVEATTSARAITVIRGLANGNRMCEIAAEMGVSDSRVAQLRDLAGPEIRSRLCSD